jgi:hypothetical protein
MADTEEGIIVSVDTEALSEVDINAIGIHVGTKQGKTLLKRKWWIKVDASRISKRCKEEFWDKNPELWKEYEENARDEKEQILSFVECYDSLSKTFGVPEKKIELISDNPAFDYGLLTRLVEKHTNRYPLRYTTDGKYRSINDIGEVAWYIGISDIVKEGSGSIQVHDHSPDDDAENIWLSHLITSRATEKIKVELGKRIRELAQEAVTEVQTMVAKKKKKDE